MTRDEAINYVARVLCDEDPLAPHPDAPIYIGMKRAKAWEARRSESESVLRGMERDRFSGEWPADELDEEVLRAALDLAWVSPR